MQLPLERPSAAAGSSWVCSHHSSNAALLQPRKPNSHRAAAGQDSITRRFHPVRDKTWNSECKTGSKKYPKNKPRNHPTNSDNGQEQKVLAQGTEQLQHPELQGGLRCTPHPAITAPRRSQTLAEKTRASARHRAAVSPARPPGLQTEKSSRCFVFGEGRESALLGNAPLIQETNPGPDRGGCSVGLR